MTTTRRFPSNPASVGAARRFATSSLTDMPRGVLDAIELMVSELATNSIRHADAAFELTLVRANDEIRIEVTDRAGGTPTMRSPKPEDPTGRGLQIVSLLSDTWGVESKTGGSGKTVWFTLAL
jgi:anti-sigma regulatory factor (Ser/Thr protein kinase)